MKQRLLLIVTLAVAAAGCAQESAKPEVVRPGGVVMVASHFEARRGPWVVTDRLLTPFAKRLGWNPSMPIAPVMSTPGLTLEAEEALPPAGLITLLVFRRMA